MNNLRASEIFRDPGLLIIAIESVGIQANKMEKFWHLSVNIEPIAVIVCGPDGTYALDIEAKPTDFELLRQNIPELNGMIELFNKECVNP